MNVKDIQLKHTQINKRRSSVKIYITVTLSIVAIVVVLFYGRFEIPYDNNVDSQPSPDADQPLTDEQPIDKKPLTDEQPIDKKPLTDEQPIDKKPLTDEQPLNDETQNILRQKYIAQMQVYETQVKPRIAQLDLPTWSPESNAYIQEQENNALNAFANNQFTDAIQYLDDLTKKVSELEATKQANFESALTAAQQEFEAGRSEQASTAIDRALLYQPTNKAAVELKNRIDVMDKVADLIKAANTAQIENDLAKEIDLLEQAIQYDPYAKSLQERLRAVIQKHNQEIIDKLLRQISQALESRDIEQTRGLLDLLKRLDANHPSLSLLLDRLDQLESEEVHRKLIIEATIAEKDDNWQSAEQYYKQAQKIFPNNKNIKERLNVASLINGYTGKIKQALSRPERLADNQISAAMQELAQDSAKYTDHSAQLKQLTEQLNDTIIEMSTLVSVTVHSDNETYISVNGVGIIGKVKKYTLKEGLKPGRYFFKGERRGFKDKLIEVHIKPAQPVDVKIVCDEPI